MQELERVDGQELNTTEEKTEVYTDSIQGIRKWWHSEEW